MTAMKPILDLIIDANIVILLAYCLWRLTSAGLARTPLRAAFPAQLTLMKTVFVLVICSPVLALMAVTVSQAFWPQAPVTASDLAIAAYLRGDIDMSAVDFEALLGSRARLTEAALSGAAPLLTLVLITLGAVGFCLVLRAVWAAVCVRRAVRNSYLWRSTGRTEVRLSHRISVPFAARGLFRRYVILPYGLVTSPRELRFALSHEFQHLRQGDVEWEMLVEFLRPLFFWNPAFLLWKREFNRLRELSCDQAIIAGRGFSREEYANCLLDFCERRITGDWPCAMNVAFVWTGSKPAKNALRERILVLGQPASRQCGRNALLLLAPVLALCIILSAATVRQPGDWSHDRLMFSTVVNLERLELINRGY